MDCEYKQIESVYLYAIRITSPTTTSLSVGTIFLPLFYSERRFCSYMSLCFWLIFLLVNYSILYHYIQLDAWSMYKSFTIIKKNWIYCNYCSYCKWFSTIAWSSSEHIGTANNFKFHFHICNKYLYFSHLWIK